MDDRQHQNIDVVPAKLPTRAVEGPRVAALLRSPLRQLQSRRPVIHLGRLISIRSGKLKSDFWLTRVRSGPILTCKKGRAIGQHG